MCVCKCSETVVVQPYLCKDYADTRGWTVGAGVQGEWQRAPPHSAGHQGKFPSGIQGGGGRYRPMYFVWERAREYAVAWRGRPI